MIEERRWDVVRVRIVRITLVFRSIPSACNNKATISLWPFSEAARKGVPLKLY